MFRLHTLNLLLALLPLAGGCAAAQNAPITIRIDASAGRHAIDPRIYGLAYANTAQLQDLNVPLVRMGGNNTSRYNWKLNADNRGADWYFESLPDKSATPGERADAFIESAKAAGAQAMMTVPMVGWVAKLGPDRGKLASFLVSRYGPQQKTDPYWPDAGNGVRPDGKNITGNDPNDANVPADAAFQREWVRHLVEKWGRAGAGGLRYYLLDNEPSIWQGTHRDVHPTGATMDEILQKTLEYARMIKTVDPNALVVGPEEWGWSGYIYSGYDQQYGAAHNWSSFPDRQKHGGMDYLPWYLDQLHRENERTGKRLLDIFTVHYYPQGGEFGNDTSEAMQLRRNRSTRSLWDPSYTDESWIKTQVRLIPRLKEWVKTYYPGTPVGITEYNWGAEGNVGGATAQADILGIFGREGLDVAARWTTPDAKTPTYKAIKLYRNYDGKRSAFGDTSVQATAPNPDDLSAFAALRSSDGALTVMVVHKALSGSADVDLALSGFSGRGTAQAWQLTTANAITRLPDISYSGGRVRAVVPAQSITLFVLPKR